MLVSGVAGTAICADLGARKMRQELDAMAVMGVDVVRRMIAPRVLALTLIMPALSMIATGRATLSGDLVAALQFGSTIGGFWDVFTLTLTDRGLATSSSRRSSSASSDRRRLLLQGHERDGRQRRASAEPSTRPS